MEPLSRQPRLRSPLTNEQRKVAVVPEEIELTPAQQEKVKEILETWDRVHLAVVFLCALGRFLRWFAPTVAALASIWAIFHGGKSS